LRFFVPQGEALEVWQIRLTNRRQRTARLSLFAAVEFCLWDAWDDATNYQRNLSLAEVEVEEGVIYHKTEYRERRDHFAYFACSGKPAGFDTQRSAFLGEGRGWENPQAIQAGALSGSVAHGWYPIGAHHLPVDLEPGAAAEFILLLGYAENPAASKFDPPGSGTLDKRRARATIRRFLDRRRWGSFRSGGCLGRNKSALQVDPDPRNRRQHLNPYQLNVTFNVRLPRTSTPASGGHRLPRRQPGLARLPPVSAGPRPTPAARSGRHPVAGRGGLPSISAADEDREQRNRQRVQR
jgi:cellobiose phosphorylase